ncbi:MULTISPECIES: hypothetical protein [unclassified Nitratiruptor]|uniref:hypothetical protein n=1 Tax=unclassified Nitratiruptor TaxID=2624044 RepID=UPI0019164BAE|nr:MULTISPECIES: hypothetical protein [unclassified Nitratiruptor]BCD60890.1 hypothetical protein NitYY0810_C1668 [Nitratiruptor sp. YY08-10]BCD64822.1 hypothetical protein NitYY0814_C1676 [Nitratiruptor sp. YY08-14]
MTIYFYAHTDNRTGLDRLRRSAALAKELQKEYEVYFMTTEFRSATYAKQHLGIKKAVGIEDFRNVGTICERGDILVYDSNEHNETIHQEMIDFFGAFIRISYDPKDLPKEKEILISPYIVGENVINGILVDMDYFKDREKSIDKLFFYGDSDYEKRMLEIAPQLKDFQMEFLEGFYFFVDMEEKLTPFFTTYHPYEEYQESIRSARTFLSFSPQSALEAVAAGAKTIYIQSKEEDEYLSVLERAGVKNLGYFDATHLQEALLNPSVPNKEYLQSLSVEKVAKRLSEYLKSSS